MIAFKSLSFVRGAVRSLVTPSSWTLAEAPRRHMSRDSPAMAAQTDYVFRQLFDYKTYTFSYLLADPSTKDAVIIDPVYEMVNRDVALISQLGLNLLFGVNTHMHADHVTGTGMLKRQLPNCKSLISKASGAKADQFLDDGDKIQFGKFSLDCRSTPGHTDGCMTFVWHEKGIAFTGDALLIRKCGRTDFQQGNPQMLYNMVHSKILSLPDDFLLYPGHDYAGMSVTSVREEKQHNERLTKSVDEFVKIMNGLNLPYPKYIDVALPNNLIDGNIDLHPEAAVTH